MKILNTKAKIIAASMFVLLVAGCGAPPKVAYPDGSNVVPANDPERIASLMTAREKARGLVAENEALRAQVAQLQNQMVAIHAAVAGVLAQASATDGAVSTAPAPPLQQAAPKPIAPAQTPASK